MKLFFTIVLLVSMCLILATGASATSIVSLDTVLSGTVDAGGSESDLSLTAISAGTAIDRYRLGFEYGTGSQKNGGNSQDLSMTSLKVGYNVYDSLATKLDAMVATLGLDGESSDLQAILVGADFTQFFSEKLFVAATVGFGVSGSVEGTGFKDDDVPVTLIRLKTSYRVNENWGLAAGYTSLSYSFATPGPAVDVDITSFTLGGFYLF